MRIDIDAEVVERIQQRVENGCYANVTAVVREAMLLLEEREKHEYVRRSLATAIAKAEQGDEIEWTPDLMDRLVEESEEMYLQGIKPHPDVLP
jgi:Arc/MetJ-type ribon-helix-helix transcriptional regulator